MSSVNTVLISTGCAVAEAVRAQFTSRGRAVIDISPSSVSLLSDSQLANAVVVDLCWGSESLRKGSDLVELVELHRNLLGRCSALAARYLMLGDGRVFEGIAEAGPVVEDAALEPASELSCVLDAAEQRVAALTDLQGLVLRVGPVLSTAPGGLLSECVSALRQELPRTLQNNYKSCPTPVADLARVLSAMTDQLACGAECRGAFHYNSSGACGTYEFVEVVYAYAAQFLLASSAISEGDAGESWQPWVPELSCEKLLGNFGIKQLPWRAWLPKLIKSLCEEEN